MTTRTHLMALYLVFVTLVCTTTTAAGAAAGDATRIPFPCVYVAKILTPEAEPSTYTHFPAEVDLLGFSRVTKITSKISFIVHDEDELARLLSLAKERRTRTIGGKIKIDLSATEDLRKQIEHKGEMGPESASVNRGDRRPQSASVYETIPSYTCYKSLQGSFVWMDTMVEQAKTIAGLNVTKIDIGNSYLKTTNSALGSDIWALQITGTAAEVANKGIFFMMSGLHARELAPPELASRWVETLINGYGNNADITAMLDSTVIHLVLQSNPDGRKIAETNPSVLRRKNMNPGTTSCNKRGVDLNRNFEYQWGLSSGSSSDPCSDTYRGTSAGSEPEVKAIIDYTKAIFPTAQRKANPQEPFAENTTTGVFLDIHSYGDLLLAPW